MTHSTKNAIELTIEDLLRAYKHGEHEVSDAVLLMAIKYHALMKAIEEWPHNGLAPHNSPLRVVDWIKRRAAEILESEFGIKP